MKGFIAAIFWLVVYAVLIVIAGFLFGIGWELYGVWKERKKAGRS